RPRRGGSPPSRAGVRVRDEVRVEVAWVVRDLAADPVRQRDLLILALELDFRDDQAAILAAKLIDFPHDAGAGDPVSGLLDQRPLAETIEHLICVRDRDLVLVLGSRRAHALPLDRDEALGVDGPDADRALLDGAEIALPVALPDGLPAPVVTLHQELLLDLLRHVRRRNRRSSALLVPRVDLDDSL